VAQREVDKQVFHDHANQTGFILTIGLHKLGV
jgi:hypothetical protein